MSLVSSLPRTVSLSILFQFKEKKNNNIEDNLYDVQAGVKLLEMESVFI